MHFPHAASNSLWLIDPRTNTFVARVPTPGSPDYEFGFTTLGAGAVWDANETGVTKIDPRTNAVVKEIPITGGSFAVAAGREGVWITNPPPDNALYRINPRSGGVTLRRSFPSRPITAQVVGEGFVWVPDADEVLKIDPSTGRVVARIPFNYPNVGAGALAVGEGSVWIADPADVPTEGSLEFGVVVRIDARTGRIITKIPVERADGVVVGAGAVWARSSETEEVTEINPATNLPIQTIPVRRADWIAVGQGAVWVLDEDIHTAVRINPATGVVVTTIKLPQTERAIFAGPEGVWVPVAGS